MAKKSVIHRNKKEGKARRKICDKESIFKEDII